MTNILAGRQILDDEAGTSGDQSLKEAEKHLLPRYNFNDVDEVAGGDWWRGYPSQSDGELPAIAI